MKIQQDIGSVKYLFIRTDDTWSGHTLLEHGRCFILGNSYQICVRKLYRAIFLNAIYGCHCSRLLAVFW